MTQWTELFRKKREDLPEDFCRKGVEHVKKIEENYWESDRIEDNKVEQLIIKLKPTDSSILISLNVNHVFGLSIYFIRVKKEITQIFGFSNKQPLMIISAYFCNISHFTGL